MYSVYRLALQVTQTTQLNLVEIHSKIVNIIFMYKDE